MRKKWMTGILLEMRMGLLGVESQWAYVVVIVAILCYRRGLLILERSVPPCHREMIREV